MFLIYLLHPPLLPLPLHHPHPLYIIPFLISIFQSSCSFFSFSFFLLLIFFFFFPLFIIKVKNQVVLYWILPNVISDDNSQLICIVSEWPKTKESSSLFPHATSSGWLYSAFEWTILLTSFQISTLIPVDFEGE